MCALSKLDTPKRSAASNSDTASINSNSSAPSYEEDVARVIGGKTSFFLLLLLLLLRVLTPYVLGWIDLQAALESAKSSKVDLEEQLQVLKTQKQVLQAELEKAKLVFETKKKKEG